MEKYKQSPFQWAGGKGKVLDILLPILNKYKQKTFCEPFVGAANVCLNFEAENYILNDLNYDLINTYNWIIREYHEYLEGCSELFSQGFDKYYEFRELFNSETEHSLNRACLFQYLNKHGFNGLCRYNKQGGFNVPIGTSTKPKNVPAQQILDFHDKFCNDSVKLSAVNFQRLFTSLDRQEDVLVYCDPPYVPLTSDFNYTAAGFGIDQQLQLRDLAKESKHTVIISNHWTPVTEQLYSDADEVVVFDVQRTISCKGSDRKKVQECIVVYGGN